MEAEKPEALRLADILQHKLPSIECLERAAIELRRLHAANADLLNAIHAILFQVVQGKVLERDACITQARAAIAHATREAV